MKKRTILMRYFFLALLALLTAAQPSWAGPVAKGRHYDARMVVRSLSARAGAPLDLAFVIRPDPGWHIYWSNPGESGYAPTFNWTLPEGVTAGIIRHPVPQLLMLGGIASNVHEGETILLQSLKLPAGLKKPVTGTVDMDMLVCSESNCVPDPLRLEMTVPVGAGRMDPGHAALFSRAEAKMPQPSQAGALFQVTKDKIRIFIPGITLVQGDKLHLFGAKNSILRDGALQTSSRAEGGLVITVSAGEQKAGGTLSGVVRIDGAGGRVRAYGFTAVPTAQMPAIISDTVAANSRQKALNSGFFLAFGAAILGGLLLNLMPCVFPILSLKALALARAGGSDRESKIEAVGYSIGAIGTILALGATLLLLRSGGQALGWAFQLQDTRVVILLLLLVTAIATNLAGMYELPTFGINSRAEGGFTGALSTGALAAFIATPCTGPFMAGALGAALLLPPAAAMAIFFGLGLGLALPFLALGFIKPLRRWLPKPGAWMEKLRQILSIPMFATALGLVWIVGRQAGVNLMAGALGAALLLALGLWGYGLRQFSGKRLWPAFVPLVMAVILSINLVNTGASADTAAKEDMDELTAIPFSESRLGDLRAAHRPVFLYMTADWCLTCKVNEATSLSSPVVAAAFRKAGVTVMRGDWTRGDPKITAFLKEQGSAGVPLYLWYPEKGKVRQLPQILTPSMLTDIVKTDHSSPPSMADASL